MKKYVSTLVSVIVALVVGYFLGAHFGSAKVDEQKTSGDVNGYNTLNLLLVQPEYMSFNDNMKDNEESKDNTIETLKTIINRIADFYTMAQFADKAAEGDETMKTAVATLDKAAEKSKAVIEDAKYALKAAQDVKDGKEVNTKKALKSATKAFDALNGQIEAGKVFVTAADQVIGKNPKSNIVLATARDMIASHCTTNASLCQNDQEVDYWGNISGLLEESDMAIQPLNK